MTMVISNSLYYNASEIQKDVDEEIEMSRLDKYISKQYYNKEDQLVYSCKNDFKKETILELFNEIKLKFPSNIKINDF